MLREYPERPIVGVGVVIFNGENVLLIRRNNPPRKNEWSLPGGAQNLGETIFETAVREVLEETQLNIKVHGIVDVVDSIHKDKSGKICYHYTLVDVFASSEADPIPVPGSDACDPIWVPKSDIISFKIWPETRRIINLAAEMVDLLP